jgi:hypothetical protein
VRTSVLDAFVDAKAIAICRMHNPVMPNNAMQGGQVEFSLDDIIRPHALIRGRKSIVHPRYIEPDKEKYMVALDVQGGEINLSESVKLDRQGEMERFVRGFLLLKDKSELGRTRYAVNFLLNPNSEVADSAHVEFQRAKYEDLRKVAETLTPEAWLKEIQNDKTPLSHVFTYAMLLGHCGNKEHAGILRKILDDRDRKASMFHLLLFGYVLLDRENGWPLIAKTIDEKGAPFLTRYAALSAARQFYEHRKDVIDPKKSLAAIASVFNVPDMSDFAVEDMRKWQRWEYCETILELPTKPGYNAVVIRKSVLRFALQCPMQQAKDYVKVQRAIDRKFVDDTEMLLALESPPTAPPKNKGTPHP